MKILPITALFLFLFSCNDQDQPVKKTAAQPLNRDIPLPKQAVSNPYAPIDVSPIDIIYFPVDYPVRKMSQPAAAPPVARVIYSRPQKQGRQIFGALLKYGEPWRLGANEATEIELFQQVTIQGKKIPKGRYIIYSIPQADQWTIVFNTNLFSWGLRQDTRKDQYRFQVPVQPTPAPIEFFTMVFEPTDTGANLLMAWDNVVARLPLTF